MTDALLVAGGGEAVAGDGQAWPGGGAAVAGGAGAGGELLLHADLHNHTRLSDGDGWAEEAFASMRAAGLDVAAITDHAYGISEPAKTIDDEGWRRIGKLADAADEPGAFVAVRGFEWSSTSLGHMNVWGGERWVEPLPLVSDGVPSGSAIADEGPADGPAAVLAFHDWLAAGDELVGFNHPGREPGRFGMFRYDPRLAERLVALEMFNRDEDYLFEGVDAGVSPLVACLDAGWRVGLAGVTDEHRGGWGFHDGLGRTGLWAPERSRGGVRAAMLRRRMFATRERGLRVDARLGGVAMGATQRLDRINADKSGYVRIEVDFFAPDDWVGHPLRLQVLQRGEPVPAIVAEFEFRVVNRTLSFPVRIDDDAGDWVVLRITDPGRAADARAARLEGYRSAGLAVAYLSPFFVSR
ncbi:CehA/McbA family metallohydrolase [Dactylosporangium sp. NPDC051541]|uniref:CehA/McbA family metallohydrolase n=1 Tax=Dactylosporangium sp. NPDC051541 TaxID=3363977 RepID=UPI00378977CB